MKLNKTTLTLIIIAAAFALLTFAGVVIMTILKVPDNQITSSIGTLATVITAFSAVFTGLADNNTRTTTVAANVDGNLKQLLATLAPAVPAAVKTYTDNTGIQASAAPAPTAENAPQTIGQ